MFQFPAFTSYTLCIYVYVPEHLPQVGFPIRTSAGRWLFAPYRSFSQLATSFVGSWCQGIHPALFIAWPNVLLCWFFNKTHGILNADLILQSELVFCGLTSAFTLLFKHTPNCYLAIIEEPLVSCDWYQSYNERLARLLPNQFIFLAFTCKK